MKKIMGYLKKLLEKNKLQKKDDIYSDYDKAKRHFDNGVSATGLSKFKENQSAVKYFDNVINSLLKDDIPLEIISLTAFHSGDERNISFTLVDLFHLRGCAKFNISDDSSIEDFTEAIKISKKYEDAYYMRGTAYFILLEDWQKAIVDINKYLTFSPDDKSGNQLLLVLDEIKQNADKINKLYNKALDDYSKGEKMLSNEDEKNFNEKKGNKLFMSSMKSLDKAYELFSQKNRPNIYLKSHSFSLYEILFKKLQCSLMLQKSESIMDLCVELYKTSKGLFKPFKNDLGAKIYYMVVDKANSQFKNKSRRSKKQKENKSKLRVNWDETNDIGMMTYYKNKPFTGVAYDLYENGNLQEEVEIVDGLKHGFGIMYSENGKIESQINYIEDEIDPKDEEKFKEYLTRKYLKTK